MNFLKSIPFFLLLGSCSNQPDATQKIEYQHHNNIEEYISRSDTLYKDGNNFKVELNLSPDNKNLFIYRPVTHMASVYNLNTLTETKKQQIRSNKKYSAFFWDNNLLFAYKEGIMYELNLQNSPVSVKRYHLPTTNSKNIPIDSEPIAYPLVLSDSNTFSLNIFPQLLVTEENEREQYLKSNRIGIFKLNGDSVTLIDEFGSFPQEMNMQEKYYGWNLPIYTQKNDSIYSYVFKAGEHIYEYNTHSKKTTAHIINNITRPKLAPIPIDSIGKFSFARKHDIENDCYVKLLYSKHDENYILFKSAATNYITADNKLVKWDDKPIDIYIIDKFFNLNKTYRIEKSGKYSINNSYTLNGFLYLINKPLDNNTPLIINKYEI